MADESGSWPSQALAKNAEMMAGLTMSFDDKLSITQQEAEEQKNARVQGSRTLRPPRAAAARM